MEKIILMTIFALFSCSTGNSALSRALQLRNECPESIEVIWIDTSVEPNEHHPMFILDADQTEILHSYHEHLFLFQYLNSEVEPNSSIFYTKLDSNEMLTFYHDSELGLSFIQNEDVDQFLGLDNNDESEYTDNNEENLSNSDVESTGISDLSYFHQPQLQLNERFVNYVYPAEVTSFLVKNEATVPIYLSKLESDQYFRIEPLILPNNEALFVGHEGQKYRITTTSQNESYLEYTQSISNDTLIIRNNISYTSLQMDIESPFDEYLELISSSLLSCGFINQENETIQNISNEMILCLTEQSFTEIDHLLSQRSQLLEMKSLMTPLLRNYTCNDDSLRSSSPIEVSTEFIHDGEYQIQTLLKMDSAQIFLIPNFLTSHECSQLMESSRSKLERAVVVGPNGAAVYSESRRAQQAGYYLTGVEDPLWNLYSRILNFTNSHTNYELQFDGQEQFTVIQYNPTDEYLPHCDGDCDGSKHRPTGRVATAVLYCKVPELGGATTFTKADIFVRPEPLSATFFTYMGPDGVLDIGYTEHSGCPIREGEKWIATAWMREGVSLEHPFTNYDPSGFRIDPTITD